MSYWYCIECKSEATANFNEHCAACGNPLVSVDMDIEKVQRAIDNHDALVGALEKALQWSHNIDLHPDGCDCACCTDLNSARQVLQAANPTPAEVSDDKLPKETN